MRYPLHHYIPAVKEIIPFLLQSERLKNHGFSKKF